MENDQVFENDISSRYAERRQPLLVRGSAQEQEAKLARQVAESPDESVASFVWNFDRTHQNQLTSLIRARKFAEAKDYYDGMCKTIEANRDDIGVLTQVGGIGGPTAKALAEKAQAITQYGFDKWEVELTDGTKANVGQILQDGSDFLGTKTRDLNAYGFSDRTAEMYLQGDETQRQTFGSIVDPFVRMTQNGKNVSGAPVVPNHEQLTRFADDLSTNWDTFVGAFGEDGIRSAVDFVKSSHATTGGMTETMRTLTRLASSGAYDGLSGAERANRVTSMYKELRNFALAGDKTGGGGQAEFSDNQLRQFDAVLVPSVREFASRGLDFDANDAKTRSAMKSVMDTISYASAAGVDVFSDSRGIGRDINGDFAKYVADSVSMDNPPANNLVAAHRNLRTGLDSIVVGGRDAQDVRVQMTGKSSDYLTVDKANGNASSNPSLDNIALGVKQYVYRSVAPYLAGGRRSTDAIAYLTDDQKRRDEFMTGLADSIRDNFHGRGRDMIAKVMATSVIDGIMNGKRTSLQDVAESVLNDPNLIGVLQADREGRIADGTPEKEQADMMRTLGRWYHGSTSGQALFGKQLAAIENHLRDQGSSESSIRSQVSRYSEMMSTALDNGVSPDVIVKSVLGVGRAYVPTYDKGKLVSISSIPANLDKVSFKFLDRGGHELTVQPGTFSRDRQGWDMVQNWLKEEKKILDADILRQKRNDEQLEAYDKKLQMREAMKANQSGF